MEKFVRQNEKDYDRTYASVDLGAIRHNIIEIKKNVRSDAGVMAVVKADAYGHGAVPVAEAVSDLVDAYGVAMIEEAVELRQSGIDKMILILGYTPESCYEEVVKYQISQTVYTYEMAKGLNDVAASLGKQVRIHIKLDTGMGRIGFFPTQESIQEVEKIASLSHLVIEGIFTHFARADEASLEPVKEPYQVFLDFVTELEQRGIHIPLKHASNSAAAIDFSEAALDMIRYGISMYGLYPSDDVNRDVVRLRPAMEWKAVVSFVKEVPAGTSISYGGTFTADRVMVVATVPVGYADGMKRDLSGKGKVLIRGCEAPILGRICMDQFMIDVTGIPGVKAGDEVTIFGRDGEKSIPVEETANAAHSFNYEFVCGITKRVPRKYVRV